MPPTQSTLFGYPVVPHNGTDTSQEAAESIKPHLNRLCSEVLNCIRSNPLGRTSDEVELALNMSHQTCSARFRDLSTCEPPLIIKLLEWGEPVKRKTRTGRNAQVWISNPSQP